MKMPACFHASLHYIQDSTLARKFLKGWNVTCVRYIKHMEYLFVVIVRACSVIIKTLISWLFKHFLLLPL